MNNALSRVGPQLAGALIFVFITGVFYSYLASHVSGVDVTSAQFRAAVSPLNPPPNSSLAQIVREASTASFHVAMVVGAGLLLLGAVVNAIGIRTPTAVRLPAEPVQQDGLPTEPASSVPSADA